MFKENVLRTKKNMTYDIMEFPFYIQNLSVLGSVGCVCGQPGGGGGD